MPKFRTYFSNFSEILKFPLLYGHLVTLTGRNQAKVLFKPWLIEEWWCVNGALLRPIQTAANLVRIRMRLHHTSQSAAPARVKNTSCECAYNYFTCAPPWWCRHLFILSLQGGNFKTDINWLADEWMNGVHYSRRRRRQQWKMFSITIDVIDLRLAFKTDFLITILWPPAMLFILLQ